MATLEDLAQRLGISKATVSRSLRHDRVIHPATRARVLELAQQIGYQGRTRRRSVQIKERTTIGVVLAMDSLSQLPGNLLVSHYLEGLAAEADAHQVMLSVNTIGKESSGELGASTPLPAMLRAREWHAVIMQGRHNPSDVAAIAREVPVVSLNWVYPQVKHDVAGMDNVVGIRSLVDHLATLGHRRLAWVPDEFPSEFYSLRLAGFLLGCAKNGLALGEQALLGFDAYANKKVSPALVQRLSSQGVTAVMCANDSIAASVIGAAMAAGLRVPDDLSVTGFDRLGIATPNGLELTSVDSQIVEVGRAAVRLALQRVAQPAAGPITVSAQAKIVLGRTTAVPRATS